jgi:hypothetical protein
MIQEKRIKTLKNEYKKQFCIFLYFLKIVKRAGLFNRDLRVLKSSKIVPKFW